VARQLAELFPSDARLVNSSHEVDALKREVEDALAPQGGAPGAHLLPLASLRACVSYVPTQALTLGRRALQCGRSRRCWHLNANQQRS
jgi:hypothetical protein